MAEAGANPVECALAAPVSSSAKAQPTGGNWLEIAGTHAEPEGGKAVRRMQARQLLVMAVTPWCQQQGIEHRVDCEYQFCKAFNSHLLPLPEWIYGAVKSVSRTTLHNWRRLNQEDATLLKGGFAKEKGGFINKNGEVRQAVEDAISYIGPTAGVANTMRVLQGSLKPELVPSYPQLLRFLLELRREDPATWLRLTNPKAHRNSMAVALGSMSRGLWPNDKWEIDFTRNDVLLQIGGKVARFSVGLCIDVATRRCKTIVSPAPKGETTAELVAQCIKAWGVPSVLRPDNGKEFINARITRLCAALGIAIDPPPPGTPQGKPHVERAFGHLNRCMEVLPSFVGHNTGQRAEIRDHKGEDNLVNLAMEAATFQSWLDQWCLEVETEHHHSALNMTPAEKLAQFVEQGWQAARCPLSDEALQELTCRSWLRKAGRKALSIDGRKYITERLGDLVGKEVLVYEVPEDICRVRLYSPDMGEFYGEALWEIYMSPAEQAEMAAKAKAIQAEVNERLGRAKRRGKKLEGQFAKRPDRLLSPTARQEVLAAVAEPLRPEVVATEVGNVVPLAIGAAAQAEPEPPNRWKVPWDWFAFHYQRGAHQDDDALKADMAKVLAEKGKHCTSALHLSPDEAYALGMEFDLPAVAEELREERAEKERNQVIFANMRRRA